MKPKLINSVSEKEAYEIYMEQYLEYYMNLYMLNNQFQKFNELKKAMLQKYDVTEASARVVANMIPDFNPSESMTSLNSIQGYQIIRCSGNLKDISNIEMFYDLMSQIMDSEYLDKIFNPRFFHFDSSVIFFVKNDEVEDFMNFCSYLETYGFYFTIEHPNFLYDIKEKQYQHNTFNNKSYVDFEDIDSQLHDESDHDLFNFLSNSQIFQRINSRPSLNLFSKFNQRSALPYKFLNKPFKNDYKIRLIYFSTIGLYWLFNQKNQ